MASVSVLALLAAALWLTIADARQKVDMPYGKPRTMRREGRSQQLALDQTSTDSSAYYDAVMASTPQGYWTMQTVTKVWGNDATSLTKASGQGEACGVAGWEAAGDSCTVNGGVFGTPTQVAGLIPSNTANKAMSFDGSDNEEVRIPDHALINTKSDGYSERTVELWFKADAPGSVQRVIYSEGNEAHSGLSMYVQEDNSSALDLTLKMFAWDRGNHDREFGTALVLPNAISCTIVEDTPYYVVMQFNAPNRSFTGWIKPLASDGADMELCGQQTQLPVGVRLTHTSGGKATIGGVQLSSRARGGASDILCGESTDANCQTAGQGHGFKGVIDEVAIYNRIVPNSELDQHFAAAPVAPAPAPATDITSSEEAEADAILMEMKEDREA